MKSIREEMVDSMEKFYWDLDTAVNSASGTFRSLERIQAFVLSLPFHTITHQ